MNYRHEEGREFTGFTGRFSHNLKSWKGWLNSDFRIQGGGRCPQLTMTRMTPGRISLFCEAGMPKIHCPRECFMDQFVIE
jgi:hypothetical protein